MKKQEYQHPDMKVVSMKRHCSLLSGSVRSVSTNPNDVDIVYGGGGNGESY